MNIGILGGTFDPIHYGHIDIALRASRLFDQVVVAVYDRPLKKLLLFSPEERIEMVRKAFDNPKIVVMGYSGLTVELCHDINAQVISLMQGKDANDLGVSFFIGLISAILGRRTGGGLVILGQMSIHGVLSRGEGLGDKLRIAMDSGAKRVMIPTENRRDFVDLPADVIDKIQIDFYSEPAQAAFKALTD